MTEAAYLAITVERSIEGTPWAVLATDGAYNTLQHLDLNDWPSITEASADELGILLDRCQKWEAEDDPSAVRLPRAKVPR